MTIAHESPVVTVNPATAVSAPTVLRDTTVEEVSDICRRATSAVDSLVAAGRQGRAALLRAVGAEFEAGRDDLVAVAISETGLPAARLNGELTRTVYQLNLFADVVDDGAYVEATIDHAADTPMGPGPDLRRMLVPLGPVAVFGASNFPLAFSVPGGDTASAVAAGCPVVVKAHESHPLTSQLSFEMIGRAAARRGLPDAVIGIVYGRRAGAALVASPHIKAVGFTGSLCAGRALLDVIAQRPDPIPFYGELSSLNPVIVTENAAAERAAEIADGLVTSITASAGQLCTKPGLVFVPDGHAGDALMAAIRATVAASPASVVLNERIHTDYQNISDQRSALPQITDSVEGQPPQAPGFQVAPRVIVLRAADLDETLTEECFGPFAVLARYSDIEELTGSLDRLPASLTATIHHADTDHVLVGDLTERMIPKSGRLLYNGFPTGVLVSWAQTHGGPWPATNTIHTSVGTTAVRRFLRPITWQNAPQHVLPAELRDGETSVPRRIDGVLTVPPTT